MERYTETVLVAFMLVILAASLLLIGYTNTASMATCEHKFTYSTCAYALDR